MSTVATATALLDLIALTARVAVLESTVTLVSPET